MKNAKDRKSAGKGRNQARTKIGRGTAASVPKRRRRGGGGAKPGALPGVGRKKTAPRKPAAAAFPGIKMHEGCAARVTVGECIDGKWEHATRACEVQLSAKGGSGRGVVGRLGRSLPHLSRVLAAAGHVRRTAILVKLLEGPATYKAVQRATKLEAGPLYHHINQLRLAGLVLPKQRDLYELTRGGRNLILVAMAMGPLVRDVRRRPVSEGSKDHAK